jgi:hypothetical protein
MTRIWRPISKALAGLFVAAVCAFSQPTISARPGTINYIEGNASIDGQQIDQGQLGHINLAAGQTIQTSSNSKAEILMTPGVFLRLGGDAELKMIEPSLTNTKVAILRGEALVDVAQLFKDNNLEVVNNGASTEILKKGLYRFSADPPQVSVYKGKAKVVDGDRHVDVKKGRQLILTAGKLKPQKFDTKDHNDLYAWSNLRSEYAAQASYATARNIVVNNYGGWGYGTGWFWNPWYSSWAFLPGAGYFSGPFGWNYYSPAALYYAPRYYIGGGHSYPVNRSIGRVTPGMNSIIHGSRPTQVRPAPSIQAPRPAPRIAAPRAPIHRSPGVRR